MRSQNLHSTDRARDDLAPMNRDVVVRLLLTPAERDAWQRAADAAGLKLSEWIRRRVQGEQRIEAPPAPVIAPQPFDFFPEAVKKRIRAGGYPTDEEVATAMKKQQASKSPPSKRRR